jgi:hypothetical protein
MSSMTLAQTVEKPITVAIDETIKSLADSRLGQRPAPFPNKPFLAKSFLAKSFLAKSFLTKSLRRPNSIVRSSLPVCARYVVAALNGDSDIGMR